MSSTYYGLDFGTTNSSLAYTQDGGGVGMVRFPHGEEAVESYRSLLYLEQIKAHGRTTVKSWSGPAGIGHYLESEGHGRLMQSLKSFLTSRSLETTDVFGRAHSLEELIARILRDIRESAERILGQPVERVVAGRPVRFVGSEKPADDEYAVKRLEKAFHLAGFTQVEFEMEPIGAAAYYESTLSADQLILIGDFGGGTSDFSLLRVGPGVLARGRKPEDLLGNAGVGIAGDAFDAKIVRHLVSPALGAGTSLRSGDKILPVPNWVYAKLERWHHLSFLRGRDVTHMLKSVRAQALEPERIAALLHIIEENLGFPLHRSVQAAKCALSESSEATFQFTHGSLEIEGAVTRAEFEQWIGEELNAIEQCVDGLLAASGVDASAVDMVFLTGGSSFVPAVRRIFETRFGASRIRTGNEFTSVAYGLAVIAGLKSRALRD